MCTSLVKYFDFFDLKITCRFLQKHVISLGGPVVTATGCRDQLAVVTHVSDCLPSNEQVGIVLYFLVLFSLWINPRVTLYPFKD